MVDNVQTLVIPANAPLTSRLGVLRGLPSFVNHCRMLSAKKPKT